MPTYEYACTSCGEHLEVVQSFRDESLTECPACGGPLRKVFGSIGIVFKGSGFYKTDSRPGDSKKSGSDTATGTTDTASSSKEPAAAKDTAGKDSGTKSGAASSSTPSTSTPSTSTSSSSPAPKAAAAS